ncbi:MAG: hypothetical protein IJI10_03330 [Eubacterium sp.]|nr:hypothetical protein [Eubacterium sp.]
MKRPHENEEEPYAYVTSSVGTPSQERMKKGIYKVKVKVKGAGNSKYKESAVKTVTFKVRVK